MNMRAVYDNRHKLYFFGWLLLWALALTLVDTLIKDGLDWPGWATTVFTINITLRLFGFANRLDDDCIEQARGK